MNEGVCFCKQYYYYYYDYYGKQYYYETCLKLGILKVRVLKILPFIYFMP